jgi:hypothetical protein
MFFDVSRQTLHSICRGENTENHEGEYRDITPLFDAVATIRQTIRENRPVRPPSESGVVLPIPAWAALQIARALYDREVISREDYVAWLKENTPAKNYEGP